MFFKKIDKTLRVIKAHVLDQLLKKLQSPAASARSSSGSSNESGISLFLSIEHRCSATVDDGNPSILVT